MNKNFWKGRNVFITGGTGLLGSWVVRYLSDYDANIVALIHNELPKPFEKIFSKATIIKGDVIDYKKILNTLKKYEIDTVFPLAAQTMSPIANKNPIPTFETNIQGAWVTLEACRNTQSVRRIIFPSSDKAYGEEEPLPYTEESKLNAKRPYTVSKSCADLIAQAYFASYDLPICITRCGNFFGGQDLRLDRLVPNVIHSALFNKELVIRSDGKYVRDFMYVEDGARASLKLAETMDNPNIIGKSFNFSYEQPLTVLELVELILQKMKSPLKPTVLGERLNEVRDQHLSSKKARDLLGWKPDFTFEEGLELTIDWYRDYFKK
jgi:CDP-glucose 4,6-dehydratase